jgi:hypothetical protein
MWRPSRRKPLKKAAEDALLKSAADAKRVYEKTRLMRATFLTPCFSSPMMEGVGNLTTADPSTRRCKNEIKPGPGFVFCFPSKLTVWF